jgi:hypothetical protein
MIRSIRLVPTGLPLAVSDTFQSPTQKSSWRYSGPAQGGGAGGAGTLCATAGGAAAKTSIAARPALIIFLPFDPENHVLEIEHEHLGWKNHVHADPRRIRVGASGA